MEGKLTIINQALLIRTLQHPHDYPVLNNFCIQNPDYFIFESGKGGELRSAKEIMTELPPGKALSDKIIRAAFDGNQLIAVIEGIADYPEVGVWYLGLYIIADKMKKTGFSNAFYKQFEKSLDTNVYNKIRIAVLGENKVGLRFWSKMAFLETDRKEKTINTEKHEVLIMEKQF